MINDAVLTTLGGGSHASGVTLGSYQVREGHELNMKWQGKLREPVLDTGPVLIPICVADLT